MRLCCIWFSIGMGHFGLYTYVTNVPNSRSMVSFILFYFSNWAPIFRRDWLLAGYDISKIAVPNGG